MPIVLCHIYAHYDRPRVQLAMIVRTIMTNTPPTMMLMTIKATAAKMSTSSWTIYVSCSLYYLYQLLQKSILLVWYKEAGRKKRRNLWVGWCVFSWRPGSAVDRFWTGCHVDSMASVWQNHIGKNIINYIQIKAIHLQSYRQLVCEGIKIPDRYNSSWNSAPFFFKSSGPLNCTFTQFIIIYIQCIIAIF